MNAKGKMRRWWWVGVIAAVLLIRLGWGWWLDRALAARMEEIRRRGEPVAAEDVKHASVRDEENAWTVQWRAVAMIAPGVVSPRDSSLNCPNYPPYSAEWKKSAQASEQANARVFSTLRGARSRPLAQFRPAFLSASNSAWLPYLNDCQHLCNLVTDGAIYSHLQGDDGEALGRLRDVLHLAHSLRQDDFLLSQFRAGGVEQMASGTTMEIAPGLRLEAGSAARELARRLMGEILDERLAWEGMRRGLMVERIGAIEDSRIQRDQSWVIGPLATRQALLELDRLDRALLAMQRDNWPAARGVLGWVDRKQPVREEPMPSWMKLGLRTDYVPRYSRWYSQWWMTRERVPELVRWFYSALAERRIAAMGLACQMFRADHAGRWPGELNELVPAYLAEIPKDAFREDGQGLGYVMLKGERPGDGGRPMVYFDEGEKIALPPATPTYWHWEEDVALSKRASMRQYRDLSWFEPGPSPKAVDHNP